MKADRFSLWLNAKLRERQRKNPRYSMRAFARHLGVNSGRLTEVLHDKRKFSPTSAIKIATKVAANPAQLREAEALIRKENRLKRQVKSFGAPAVPPARVLTDEEFESIADPLHYSLLALFESPEFKYDPAWFAAKLGTSQTRVKRALARLTRLNLIRKEPGSGAWVLGDSWVTTPSDRSSAALRRHHKSKIKRAMLSLEAVPINLRDVTSITMCADPAKLDLAKALIKEFRMKISDLLSCDDQRDVYHLNVQLFPEQMPAVAKGKR